MEKFTIFGNPVEHSKSPQMHNLGFKHIKYEGFYDKTLLEDGLKIKENFLKNNLKGANITVPHKESAFCCADEVKGLAKKIGAVNTYINEGEKVIAYNTDAPGFIKAIEEFGTIDKAIILGAGGTAKAIAVAFNEANIETIIINRSRKNRLEFFEELNCRCFDWEEIEKNIVTISKELKDKKTLIINSTSAGLKDKKLPIDENILEQLLQNGNFAIDCIYGKITPFLQKVKDIGLRYKDGEDMLLYQGVLAFELFTGVKADKELVEAMRKGLKEE